MRTLRVLPEAEEELAQAAEWYETKRPGLGIELVAIVDRAFDEIQDAPLSYALWRSDRPYRRNAVAHAKRRPGFWLDRLPSP